MDESDVPDHYRHPTPDGFHMKVTEDVPVTTSFEAQILEAAQDQDLERVAELSIEWLMEQCHQTALEKGWWKDHEHLVAAIEHWNKAHEDSQLPEGFADLLFKMARSMLIVSEVSEGVEGLRMGDPPDDKVPEFSSFTVELGDNIIRTFDLSKRFNLPLGKAIVAKALGFNKKRSYKHGGKSI